MENTILQKRNQEGIQMKQYNKQLIENYHSNNYFGCVSDGVSEEEQEAIKLQWIENMEKMGWVLDVAFITDDNWTDYERDGQRALDDAVEYLAGAF
jgi:hypothetical protein